MEGDLVGVLVSDDGWFIISQTLPKIELPSLSNSCGVFGSNEEEGEEDL